MCRLCCIGMFATMLIQFTHAGTVEEARIAMAAQHMPAVVTALNEQVQAFESAWKAAQDARGTLQLAQNTGLALWQAAKTRLRTTQDFDDRPLYWARLQITQTMRDTAPGFPIFPGDREAALNAFEHASRGMDGAAMPSASNTLRIVLTGFDPFLLDWHIDQSNPAGVVALMLDNTDIPFTNAAGQPGLVHVSTAIFPVRFADFDAGMVEGFLSPRFGVRKQAAADWLDAARERLGGAQASATSASPDVDMVMTVSMGDLVDTFKVEHYSGRRRSTKAPDNLNLFSGGTLANPIPPKLDNRLLQGAEFTESSLPISALVATPGHFKVMDNRWVRISPDARYLPDSLTALFNKTAFEGGGGGYLSNEISYRSLRLRDALGLHALPVGHLHTPLLLGFEPAGNAAVVAQVKAMIASAAAAISKMPASR
ncbi:MAG: hypothetical protein JO142_16825 [Burkholderiales bacterium]|nr:hypothetical protein [Burkholderiales bacterium]